MTTVTLSLKASLMNCCTNSDSQNPPTRNMNWRACWLSPVDASLSNKDTTLSILWGQKMYFVRRNIGKHKAIYLL